MPTFEVGIYYEGTIDQTVEADTPEEAKEIAESDFDRIDDSDIIANITQFQAQTAEETTN